MLMLLIDIYSLYVSSSHSLFPRGAKVHVTHEPLFYYSTGGGID